MISTTLDATGCTLIEQSVGFSTIDLETTSIKCIRTYIYSKELGDTAD